LASSHNSLGLVLIKQGQLDKAINHFQEAVKLQPQDARARSNLDAALRAKNATSANSSKP
jgi:Flp pilus assembly protein TadD